MAELTVRFDLKFSARMLRWAMAGAMLLAAAPELASESVSLTTYYPAPSGVYTQLIATSNAFMARDAGYLDVGTNLTPPTPPGIGAVKEYVQNGAVLIASPYVLSFGNYSELDADQGGSIELGGNNAVAGTGVPYIDFHWGGAGVQDFNARIINDGNNQLSVDGAGGVGATGFDVYGRIGSNGYPATSGYPAGWGGGVHSWDVYAEGTVGTGTGGSLQDSMSGGLVRALPGAANVGVGAFGQNACYEVTFAANSAAPCVGYITVDAGVYVQYQVLENPGFSDAQGTVTTNYQNGVNALCCSFPVTGALY
ncbi:MAG: hypothetical protein HKL90_01630 [Elusimicrobia bacterium]|nr:hypothetical protein [Elusimicrobiota bacterium]